MKANIPPFYVGQKVVYIKSEWFPKDSVHIVSSINRIKCGCWEVYVDGKGWGKNNQRNKNVICKGCYGRYFSVKTYLGYLHSDFKPIEEMKAPLLTFEKIKEEEKEEVLIMN